MSDRRSEPRILLVQHGARHRYALAQTLWEAGMLEAFYTDATAHSPLGCVAGFDGTIRCLPWKDARARWAKNYRYSSRHGFLD